MTGGENVRPPRVEAALEQIRTWPRPGVAGRPDPEWGEAVTAFVVGEASEPELEACARERLAAYEVPNLLWLSMPSRVIPPAS